VGRGGGRGRGVVVDVLGLAEAVVDGSSRTGTPSPHRVVAGRHEVRQSDGLPGFKYVYEG
jgi:hypothetical protein